jgi:hypothetical protein
VPEWRLRNDLAEVIQDYALNRESAAPKQDRTRSQAHLVFFGMTGEQIEGHERSYFAS